MSLPALTLFILSFILSTQILSSLSYRPYQSYHQSIHPSILSIHTYLFPVASIPTSTSYTQEPYIPNGGESYFDPRPPNRIPLYTYSTNLQNIKKELSTYLDIAKRRNTFKSSRIPASTYCF